MQLVPPAEQLTFVALTVPKSKPVLLANRFVPVTVIVVPDAPVVHVAM